MPINAITADDTLTIYGKIITDFADGATSSFAFNNDLVGVKTGKNGNTIFSKNETGNNATAVLRIMRGSSDDRFLQSKMDEVERDFPSVVLAAGEFVKRIGDGNGNVVADVYQLEGGIFVRKVDTQENVEGDTEQGVSIYNLIFAYATRGIK